MPSNLTVRLNHQNEISGIPRLRELYGQSKQGGVRYKKPTARRRLHSHKGPYFPTEAAPADFDMFVFSTILPLQCASFPVESRIVLNQRRHVKDSEGAVPEPTEKDFQFLF